MRLPRFGGVPACLVWVTGAGMEKEEEDEEEDQRTALSAVCACSPGPTMQPERTPTSLRLISISCFRALRQLYQLLSKGL